jgi:hypothetical protein
VTGTDTTATVQAIKDNAQRLGLTWQIQYATVVDAASPGATTVAFDGDTLSVATPAVSLVGALANGQRVAVLTTPPDGAYIIGQLTPSRNWTAYTPAWTSLTGVNPTPANHDLSGSRYKYIDSQLAVAEVRILFGGAGYGTGVYAFGLPFASTAGSVLTSTGAAHMLDAGVAEYACISKLLDETRIRMFYANNSVGATTAGAFTFGNGDTLQLSILFEPA